jgi:hypothetical protein
MFIRELASICHLKCRDIIGQVLIGQWRELPSALGSNAEGKAAAAAATAKSALHQLDLATRRMLSEVRDVCCIATSACGGYR